MRVPVRLWLAAVVSVVAWRAEAQTEIHVRDGPGLRQAAAQAKPGTRIALAPGEYPGGFYFAGLKGEPDKPIIIAAADPGNPPLIRGGGSGMHLVDPAYVELHHLTLTGATGNGLNIDDGGSYDTPAHHLVLRGLKVTDVGPEGNRDGIKLSGVCDFRVEGCTIERWGTGGSAIDMVGCHRGVIEGNLFRHTALAGNTGVQAKGGTSGVAIRRNRFEDAGDRAVNIGGSTGLQFFRPPLKPGAEHCEARDIRVEGNTFIGSRAPVAFVGVDGSVVRFNTLYRPRRWALRILQETREPGFVPSRRGEFCDNLIVFRSDEWSGGGVNIGPHTAPHTFKFARNFWYCLNDAPRTKSLLKLPAEETDGLYGKDPLLRDPEKGDLRLQPSSPASKVGAEALALGQTAERAAESALSDSLSLAETARALDAYPPRWEFGDERAKIMASLDKRQ
ncbi:MAG: hypothetical protein FJ272_13360, partial [Planctomycetes bacterium]|nr:hypothetical protein [Planctomycetota bacterium]